MFKITQRRSPISIAELNTLIKNTVRGGVVAVLENSTHIHQFAVYDITDIECVDCEAENDVSAMVHIGPNGACVYNEYHFDIDNLYEIFLENSIVVVEPDDLEIKIK